MSSDYNIQSLLHQAQILYENHQYCEALKIVENILKTDKSNPIANNLIACILIESRGRTSQNNDKIHQAISHLEKCRENNPNNPSVYENLGNAYYLLAVSEFEKRQFHHSKSIINDFKSAKENFTKSLVLDNNQPKLWINKGNVLDYLGRYLESLECYDKAILLNSHHNNAWGNRGITCQTLSNKTVNPCMKNQLFFDSMIFYKIELSLFPDFKISNEMKEFVKKFVIDNNISFDLENFIERSLPRKKNLLKQSFNINGQKGDSFKSFFTDFCSENGLFLNLFFDHNDSPCFNQDLLSIQFIAAIDDESRSTEIITRWESLIDDFMTARTLLSLAQFNPDHLGFLNNPKYRQDYSLTYFINIELLKNSFLTAMHIFDKIAFFLNEYAKLGLTDENVNFYGSNSIFNHRKELIQENNWSMDLIALESIKEELEKGEFKKLTEMRNLLVHRYLKLQSSVMNSIECQKRNNNSSQRENYSYVIDIDDFFILTISALKIIRNSLFSLSFFLSEREHSSKDFPTMFY